MSRVIVGLQPVREAIAAHGPRLSRVMVEAKRDAPRLEALARFAHDRGVRVERVARRELDVIAHGVHHQGAAAIAPELALADFESVTEGPVVVLDEIEDPQNFGAIVRSAVALGARAVIFPEHHAAPLSMATFRASAGAIEHATLVRVSSLNNALRDLQDRGFSIVGLDMQGEDLRKAELAPPVALVIGAEGKGLRKAVRAACSLLVKIPMAGPIGSLNASVSAAVALYEVLRR
jgi:23S rRNA (guanosine2251-2'-O)-methyltransferase